MVDVRRYIRWATAHATKLSVDLDGIDRDDAVGIALLALVEVAGRFDPDRGVKFTTFAYWRIHGALIDAQRARWGGRKSRGHFNLELALDAAPQLDNGHADRMEAVVDLEHAGRLVAQLPERERALIERHATGETMQKVGARFGISKFWACRVEQGAQAKLRKAAA